MGQHDAKSRVDPRVQARYWLAVPLVPGPVMPVVPPVPAPPVLIVAPVPFVVDVSELPAVEPAGVSGFRSEEL